MKLTKKMPENKKRRSSVWMRVAAVLWMMVLCVSVPGCDGSKEKQQEKKETEEETQTAWTHGEDILAVIDGEEITVEEGKFYAYCQQANYEAYYLAYYQQELDWGAQADESGETMEAKVKKEVMEEIKRKVMFSHHAQEYDVKLTEKEEEEVAEKVDKFLKESDEKILEASGATKELVSKIYTRNALYEKVYDTMAEQFDIQITQSEAKQAKITAVELASTQEKEKSEEELEKDAQAILKMAKDGQTLSVAAKAYGYEATTGNVGKGDMNGNELEQTCLSMKTGEYKIFAYSEYVYVLYCDSDWDKEATGLAKEEMEKTRIEEEAVKIYESWLESAQVEWNQSRFDEMKFDTAIFTMEDMESVQDEEESTDGK